MSETMDNKKPNPIHWAWVILAVCFVNLFINYSVRLGYGVVLPEMIRDLDFSRTAGGSIYNAYLLVYIALSPFTGFLTDRIGARRVISVCALFLGIGVLLMGTVRDLFSACLFYAIVGLGASGMWTPVIAVVQRWFSVRKRGLALGVLSSGYGLGFATMGAVFPLIVRAFNWRFAWYFLGTAALVMVLFNALLLRSDPESAGHRPWGGQGGIDSKEVPDGNDSVPGKKVLQYKSFWIIGLSYFCIAYSLYGVTTFMVDFATDQVGLPLQRASFLATIHGMCQIIGVLTILPLSDYLGRKRTILISNAVITLTLAGILFAGHSWVMLYFLVGLQGVFYGVTFPIYGACAGDYFPRRLMATVIGAWTPFYGIGAILSHWACGMLRDVTGTYTMAFGTDVLMAAAGLGIFSRLQKKRS